MAKARPLLSVLRRSALCLLLVSGASVTSAPAGTGPADGHSDEHSDGQAESRGERWAEGQPDLRAIAPMIAAGADLWRKASETGRERIANAAAPFLARWITAARADSIAAGARPIPSPIRAQLAGYVSPAVMDRVRFRIGWPEDRGLHREVFGLLRTRAITLDDVIVFRDKDIAADPAIWVHELLHVQQYRRWGVEEFARRYLRQPDEIETEAWNTTARYRMWALEGRPSARTGPATGTGR